MIAPLENVKMTVPAIRTDALNYSHIFVLPQAGGYITLDKDACNIQTGCDLIQKRRRLNQAAKILVLVAKHRGTKT